MLDRRADTILFILCGNDDRKKSQRIFSLFRRSHGRLKSATNQDAVLRAERSLRECFRAMSEVPTPKLASPLNCPKPSTEYHTDGFVARLRPSARRNAPGTTY